MPQFWHNWKTSMMGIMAFLAYLGSHQSQALAVVPTRYQEAAGALFAASILLLGFAAKDAGTGAVAGGSGGDKPKPPGGPSA